MPDYACHRCLLYKAPHHNEKGTNLLSARVVQDILRKGKKCKNIPDNAN